LQQQQRDPVFGVPDRVAIEFPATQVLSGAPLPQSFASGPAVRLRAVNSGSTARLLIDVPGLSDVGTFFRPDPNRLIVDLRGTPRGAKPSPASAKVAEPQLPKPASPQAPIPPARRFKIVIDPGHGGQDPGAVGVDGLAEKDVVLAIARRLRDALRKQPRFDVILTRDSDVFLRLEERTARANAEKADFFISVHANASPNTAASGVETYYLNNTNDRATLRLASMENGLQAMTGQRAHGDAALILSDLIQNYKINESVALARRMQRALVERLASGGMAVHDLGVKRGPFYVLVGAGMPGVLVEVSFITHPEEGARLGDPAYQELLADGLLRGLEGAIENSRATGSL
jgi:N-acetylmuramoyl-L-alanine amidase